MPRLAHGETVKVGEFHAASAAMADRNSDVDLAFAAAGSVDPTRFDFLFPDLQQHEPSLLPDDPATVQALVKLGRAMRDLQPSGRSNSRIPAAYTYFGQFVDHDITLEAESASLPALLDPGLSPLSLAQIRRTLVNLRTASLDLDCVYSFPVPRSGSRMKIGVVSPLGNPVTPTGRPEGKGDDHDLPRDQRSPDRRFDRAALIGDPRNGENTIVAQLHLAFLKTHNVLADRGMILSEARRTLRQPLPTPRAA